MIYLSTTAPQKVILQSNKNFTTTSTSEDLLTKYYTFKITSCDTFKEYVFSPQNFSQSPYYDAFTVSVGNTVSMTGSAVMINAETGQYNFSIYKMPNEYNLNIASASYMTEQGILQITATGINAFNWSSPNYPADVFTQSDADTIKAFTEL